ncbi:hypothetical protein IKF15_00060 [Candidatus Saccharibacteria bacterium]|nr:hypothetical protein [Candidatus Saccharibacteria bacterium]
MDILITLPKNLIEKILSGEKTVEVRTRRPIQFDLFNDIVYVVQKGTRRVVMNFSIEKFDDVDMAGLLFLYNEGKVGVDLNWLMQYAANKRMFSIWHIGCVTSMDKIYVYLDDLYIKVAPQSYTYVKTYL